LEKVDEMLGESRISYGARRQGIYGAWPKCEVINRGDHEDYYLMGCDAVYSGSYFQQLTIFRVGEGKQFCKVFRGTCCSTKGLS
jgi:hypothetical protein